MSEHVLSQRQIDALITDYREESTGPRIATRGNIVVYDFQHPLLVSKEQLRSLRFLHETFAWNLGVELTNQLRMDIDIQYTNIDQVVFSEFTQSIAQPSVLSLFTVNELGGQALFELDPQFALLAVERLSGGDCQYLARQRPLTTIEQIVFRKVLSMIYKELQAAWEPYFAISVKHHSIESSPENIQAISPVDATIVVYQQIKISDWKFTFNINYPYDLLERHLSGDLFRSGSSHKAPLSEEDQVIYQNKIKDVKVPLRVELGKANITVNEMLQMVEGDALMLDQETSKPLNVYLKNQPLLKAYPGRLGQKRAIRILDFIENKRKEVKK